VNLIRLVTKFSVCANLAPEFDVQFHPVAHMRLLLRSERDLYVWLNLLRTVQLFPLIILGNRPRAGRESQIIKTFRSGGMHRSEFFDRIWNGDRMMHNPEVFLSSSVECDPRSIHCGGLIVIKDIFGLYLLYISALRQLFLARPIFAQYPVSRGITVFWPYAVN
jgi:hypothetical protein